MVFMLTLFLLLSMITAPAAALTAPDGDSPQVDEVFQFEVTIPADGGTFAIPLNGNLNGGDNSYDWDIEWGDGANEHRSSSDPGAPQNASDSPGVSHSYAAGGIYTITIRPAGSEEAWLGAFGFGDETTPTTKDRLLITKVISPLTPLMTRTHEQITGVAAPPSNEWAYTFYRCYNMTMGDDFTFSGGWDNITSVGSYFAQRMFYGGAPVQGVWERVYNALAMNEVFNLPQGLTTVGDYFAEGMFGWVGARPDYYDGRNPGSNYYSGGYTPFTMNEVFNLPQGLTTVGGNFASSMFYHCNGIPFTMNEVFNLPQGLTSVGGMFAKSMFEGCDGPFFNMNETFNLPPGITSVGDYFAEGMFYGCNGDAFNMNEAFNLPQGITTVGNSFASGLFMDTPYGTLIGNGAFSMNDVFNLPQGITSAGDNFASYLFSRRSDDTFTMNEIFNLPQGITTAGDKFASSMFLGCTGATFNMNEIFNLPQSITSAGDDFAYWMFYGGYWNLYQYFCSPVFTMNEIFNLPQGITSAGDNFAYGMFEDCFGEAFTMNEAFNLPQDLETAGAGFASNMFAGCKGSGFLVNDVFKFPVLNAGDLNKDGVFYMTFYNMGAATAQPRSAASIIGGNATPANAIGTFFGSACFLDRAYIPVNWGGSGQGSVENVFFPSYNSFTFPSASLGYDQTDSSTFRIYNFGTTAIENVNISISGDFELGALSSASIQPGESVAFTANPSTGLNAGIYTGIITISADGCLNKTISLSFTVLAGAGLELSEAKVEGFNVSTDHSHYGSLNYGEDVQWVTLDVIFDRDVYYDGGLAIFDEITAYLGSGQINSYRATPTDPDLGYDYDALRFAKVLEDGRTLRLQMIKTANEDGRLLVFANGADKALPSVTDAQGRLVVLPDVNVTAPTGIRFDIVSQIAGTETSPAQTILEFVTPIDMTRGTYHLMALHNGELFSQPNSGAAHPLANFGSAHAYNYLDMALSLGTGPITQGTHVYPATAEHGGFIWDVAGRTLTITSSVNSPGEVWDFFVVHHPRDNADAQAKLDKTALNAAITEANAAVQGDYSAEAWAVLQNELAIANVRAASIYYIQSELDGTAASLLAALGGGVMKGDVNGDGFIDFDDVLDLMNHYTGITVLQGNALQAADVNGDGFIDFDDVLDLMNHYTGIAPLQ